MEGRQKEKYRHPNHGDLPTTKGKKDRFEVFYEKPKQRPEIDIDRPRDPKTKPLTIRDLELYQREFIQPLIDRIDELERELYYLKDKDLADAYNGRK